MIAEIAGRLAEPRPEGPQRSVARPVVVELGPESNPQLITGAHESGLHRAPRDVEDLGDRGGVELLPVVQLDHQLQLDGQVPELLEHAIVTQAIADDLAG